MMVLLSLLASFSSALLLVPGVRRLAQHRGWVDNPDNKRKTHSVPTPNTGGLAIAASFGIGLVVLIFTEDIPAFEHTTSMILTVLGALVILAAGFYDDIRKLGAKKKFFIELIVAYLLLHAGFRIEIANIPYLDLDSYQEALLSIPLTMLWIVGIINAINLLDGLDGLAAGVSLIAFACLAAIFSFQGNVPMFAISLIMAAVLTAFLFYNFNPASIFMGDSGSLFLGFMLSVLTLSLKDQAHASPILALLIPVVLLSLPIFDTTLCILRRLTTGRSPFAPDKDHIHHRMANFWSRKSAVLVLYGIALWFGLSAVLLTQVDLVSGIVLVSITLILPYVWITVIFDSAPLFSRKAKSKLRKNDRRRRLLLKQHSPDGVS